ncbi:MAG: hypothetical protein JOS17DRAFT_558785 [Linnemannia elongata]|nr:MAG: hypothetical protein JOS17DRAFT_558785 [Linnemannia elongata]
MDVAWVTLSTPIGHFLFFYFLFSLVPLPLSPFSLSRYSAVLSFFLFLSPTSPSPSFLSLFPSFLPLAPQHPCTASIASFPSSFFTPILSLLLIANAHLSLPLPSSTFPFHPPAVRSRLLLVFPLHPHPPCHCFCCRYSNRPFLTFCLQAVSIASTSFTLQPFVNTHTTRIFFLLRFFFWRSFSACSCPAQPCRPLLHSLSALPSSFVHLSPIQLNTPCSLFFRFGHSLLSPSSSSSFVLFSLSLFFTISSNNSNNERQAKSALHLQVKQVSFLEFCPIE